MKPAVYLNTRADLAEGPVWHGSALWWVEITAGRLCCHDPARPGLQTWDVGGFLGAAVPAADGSWILCRNNGFYRLDAADGTVRLLCKPEAGKRDNRFNDGKCDPLGRLWAGTMAIDATPGAGSLYRFDASGACARVFSKVGISNGLGWTADGQRMFYVDTATGCVEFMTYDSETGLPGPRNVLRRFEQKEGNPDGLCVDAEDHLWIALWDGSAVLRIDGLSGRTLEKISLPVTRPTSCAMAQDGRLFITTARHALSTETLHVQPEAGAIFVVQTETQGLAPTLFANKN